MRSHAPFTRDDARGQFSVNLSGSPSKRPFTLALALTPRRTVEFLVPITRRAPASSQ